MNQFIFQEKVEKKFKNTEDLDAVYTGNFVNSEDDFIFLDQSNKISFGSKKKDIYLKEKILITKVSESMLREEYQELSGLLLYKKKRSGYFIFGNGRLFYLPTGISKHINVRHVKAKLKVQRYFESLLCNESLGIGTLTFGETYTRKIQRNINFFSGVKVNKNLRWDIILYNYINTQSSNSLVNKGLLSYKLSVKILSWNSSVAYNYLVSINTLSNRPDFTDLIGIDLISEFLYLGETLSLEQGQELVEEVKGVLRYRHVNKAYKRKFCSVASRKGLYIKHRDIFRTNVVKVKRKRWFRKFRQKEVIFNDISHNVDKKINYHSYKYFMYRSLYKEFKYRLVRLNKSKFTYKLAKFDFKLCYLAKEGSLRDLLTYARYKCLEHFYHIVYAEKYILKNNNLVVKINDILKGLKDISLEIDNRKLLNYRIKFKNSLKEEKEKKRLYRKRRRKLKLKYYSKLRKNAAVR